MPVPIIYGAAAVAARIAAKKLAEKAVTKAGTAVVRATVGKKSAAAYKAKSMSDAKKLAETKAAVKAAAKKKPLAEPKSAVKVTAPYKGNVNQTRNIIENNRVASTKSNAKSSMKFQEEMQAIRRSVVKPKVIKIGSK